MMYNAAWYDNEEELFQPLAILHVYAIGRKSIRGFLELYSWSFNELNHLYETLNVWLYSPSVQ